MTGGRSRALFAAGLIVTIGIAVGLSQVASDQPDGLEFVAEQEGFADTGTASEAPLGGYGEDLTPNSGWGRALAGLVGVLVTLGVGWGLFWLIRRRRAAD